MLDNVPYPVAIPIQMPLYVWFMPRLLSGVVILVIGVMLLNPFPQPPLNPFSAYGALLDDQPGSTVASQGFVCTEGTVGVPYAQVNISALCEYLPAAGPFERVEVLLSGNHRAELITFTVRENALMVGDLALLWGKPPIITSAGEQMTFDWPGGEWSALANTRRGRFSYLMPLYRVTFMAAD